MRLLAELVFGEISKALEESLILNLYKGKGEALDRGNYLGIKLTDQVMKLLDRVLDSSISKMVNRDGMQFEFVPGRGTTDATHLLSASGEVLCHKETTFIAFVNLEKAFDIVQRKILWWTLRSVRVEEWAIRIIHGMYTNARSGVRVNGQYSEEF